MKKQVKFTAVLNLNIAFVQDIRSYSYPIYSNKICCKADFC